MEASCGKDVSRNGGLNYGGRTSKEKKSGKRRARKEEEQRGRTRRAEVPS
jgi:hypothetical protein